MYKLFYNTQLLNLFRTIGRYSPFLLGLKENITTWPVSCLDFLNFWHTDKNKWELKLLLVNVRNCYNFPAFVFDGVNYQTLIRSFLMKFCTNKNQIQILS